MHAMWKSPHRSWSSSPLRVICVMSGMSLTVSFFLPEFRPVIPGTVFRGILLALLRTRRALLDTAPATLGFSLLDSQFFLSVFRRVGTHILPPAATFERGHLLTAPLLTAELHRWGFGCLLSHY